MMLSYKRPKSAMQSVGETVLERSALALKVPGSRLIVRGLFSKTFYSPSREWVPGSLFTQQGMGTWLSIHPAGNGYLVLFRAGEGECSED